MYLRPAEITSDDYGLFKVLSFASFPVLEPKILELLLISVCALTRVTDYVQGINKDFSGTLFSSVCSVP
jgi:hypothetical protein